ncbi:MAG: TIGR02206 family membrane protein [Anaerolineae bacterium]|nr:TIGR02206 family membrane protein [Anaerolineae bacterium]
MDQFFVKDYTGAPFDLFGPAHLIALAVVGMVSAALLYTGPRFPQTWRPFFRYGLAFILLLNEAAWHAWNGLTGQWTIQTMLPLHLCSVFVFISAALLMTKNYRMYEFVYLLGIAGATQALLTPDAGPYGFPHFRFFQIFISHGAIVISAIYMTSVETYRPTGKSLWRVALWGNVYLLGVGLVNALIGSNYLFIARKPPTASLLDVLPPWPWYILWMEVLGLLVVLLLYLPFAIWDWRKTKKTQPNWPAMLG